MKVDSYDYEGITIDVENKIGTEEERKKRMAAICVAIRGITGMNRREFSDWLGIPYRTIQDWERGVSQVPDYILKLIAYKVRIEDQLKKGVLKYVDSEDNR